LFHPKKVESKLTGYRVFGTERMKEILEIPIDVKISLFIMVYGLDYSPTAISWKH